MSRSHLRGHGGGGVVGEFDAEGMGATGESEPGAELRLQQKEAEVTELLSYVEEMMKEKGALCVC